MKAKDFIEYIDTNKLIWFIPSPDFDEWIPGRVFGVDIINNAVLVRHALPLEPGFTAHEHWQKTELMTHNKYWGNLIVVVKPENMTRNPKDDLPLNKD